MHSDYKEISNLAKYPFEPYWPSKKLKVCITGAGGFIASHLAKRLKSEGHYVIACDWKRNEHYSVSCQRARNCRRQNAADAITMLLWLNLRLHSHPYTSQIHMHAIDLG